MAKTSLITGGAKGIGYAFSRLFAADGYDLILVGMNTQHLEEKQRELSDEFDVNVRIITQDLSEHGAAESVFNQLIGTRVDVLVNNAGFGMVGSFAESDWERELRMINLQVITVTRLTHLMIKKMREFNSGKILNVSSVAAFYPGPYMAVYYATKSYILSFSEAIAEELKSSGITVTVLCPGVVDTGFQETAGSNHKLTSGLKVMDSPEKVASYGYKAMQKGKRLAVPGILSKLMVSISRLLPRKAISILIAKLQKKNQ